MDSTILSGQVLQYIVDNYPVNYKIFDIGNILHSFHYDFHSYNLHAIDITKDWSSEAWEDLIDNAHSSRGRQSHNNTVNELSAFLERFIDTITERELS